MTTKPPGFVRLRLNPSGFIDGNGPLYGRMQDQQFVLGFAVEQRHCNAAGSCHGGMLATLADMLLAMGTNLQANLSSFLLTVNLTCDFLGTIPAEAWIEGRVEVLRITRTLVFAQGVLTHDGTPVLRCNGILRRPPAPDPAFAAARLLPPG